MYCIHQIYVTYTMGLFISHLIFYFIKSVQGYIHTLQEHYLELCVISNMLLSLSQKSV